MGYRRRPIHPDAPWSFTLAPRVIAGVIIMVIGRNQWFWWDEPSAVRGYNEGEKRKALAGLDEVSGG